MIYFDNAATSWPKPASVSKAMVRFLDNVGANPGRAGHRLAIESGRVVYAAREAIANLVNATDPLRVVFTANVTEALNLVLYGLLAPGDHIVTGSLEHNSVMRPLRDLERLGVALTVVEAAETGAIDAGVIARSIRPNTRLVVINHASNVVGTLAPIAAISEIARAHNVPLLVDAAQTGGAFPIDVQTVPIDLLAFTGHKSLYGPMGTGGLVFGDTFDPDSLRPLKRGGTGSRSELEEQPCFLPDKFESGTLNVPGLAGLTAGVRSVLDRGVHRIRQHEEALVQRLIRGLSDIPGVMVYGTGDATQQTATVSFNIRGVEPSDAGLLLDDEYGILCRVGLHCSPAAHKTIGTYPRGTVRFGLGATNTLDEVDAALDAVRYLAKETL